MLQDYKTKEIKKLSTLLCAFCALIQVWIAAPSWVRNGGRKQHLSRDEITCDYSVTRGAVYRVIIFIE